jgi:hypothetical protein
MRPHLIAATVPSTLPERLHHLSHAQGFTEHNFNILKYLTRRTEVAQSARNL